MYRVLKSFQRISESCDKARSKLYPDAPALPSVSLSLPLEQYAGTYSNEGYGPWTFTAHKDDEGGYLKCDLHNITWIRTLIFRPVNGEHWLGTESLAHSPLKFALKAKTEIGADGKVDAFHIGAERTMPDTLLRFKRV